MLSHRSCRRHSTSDDRRRSGRLLPDRKELIVPQVRGEGVLEGLADIPWGDLSHAYGSAGDMPGLLRAIASGDAKAAGDAVSELFGNIWHQGTVYQATPYAVPFLARMAAVGIRAGDLVQLLGCIAESTDDTTGGRARTAVAAEAGLLIPLLRDADPGIRAGTAWTLAQCRAGDEAFTAVRAQWAAEEKPVVRTTLLKAMPELAPAQALPLMVRAAASGASAGERLVAAWACVTAGRAWDDDLRAASLAWLAEGLDLENGWWGDSNHGPFAGLLFDLAGRGDFTVASGLAIASLAMATAPGTLGKAVWDVEQFTDQYRVPVPELTTALERLTPGPEASRMVNWLQERLGPEPSAAAARIRRGQPGADTLPLNEIREGLASRRGVARAALAARALASPPDWLLPALRAALDISADQERPDIVGRIEAARTLWHFTADASVVIPVIAEGLRPPNSRFRYILAERKAAEAAADLGPAAAPLVPGLLRLLEEPICCPAAAEALLRADPEVVSIPLADLADYLVTSAGAEKGRFQRQALDLLREIGRRDPSAVSAQARARLRDFADRPKRVIQAGTYDEIIREDEALRIALRDLLRDLSEPSGHGA
jgi:hypothetical protein